METNKRALAPLLVALVAVAGAPEDPPFIWPAGRQAAPSFLLRDQNGDLVSIAAYRGAVR